MHVAVIGLGRIGLSISLALAKQDIKVYGYDVDEDWIKSLRERKVKLLEKNFIELLEKTLNKTFYPLNFSEENLSNFEKCKVIFVCIGVKLGDDIEKVYTNLFEKLKNYIKGKVIVIRTTVPVGTTRKLREYIEKTYKLIEGKDFYLAFSPERLVEGKGIEEEEKLPKIIGIFSEGAKKELINVFSVFKSKIYFTSPEVAEFVKLIDNSYRNLLFNFSNELSILADNLNIDIIEAIRLAKADYERNSQLALPGPVSGYCLSKDPLFLHKIFEQFEDDITLSFLARRINEKYLKKIIKKSFSLCSFAKRIAVLGISFKKDVDDFRDSHSLDLIKFIREIKENVEIYVHDPFLNMNRYTSDEFFKELNVKILEDLNKLQEIKPEIIFLSTPHSFYLENVKKLDDDWLLVDLYYALYEFKEKFKKAKIVVLGK